MQTSISPSNRPPNIRIQNGGPSGPYIELDAEMAFELYEAIKTSRMRMLITRSEMLDEGIREGVEYYDFRLGTLATVRKRLLGLINLMRKMDHTWNIFPNRNEDQE